MPVQLKASKRGERGTHKARALRQKGLIPAVIYGHGKECLPVTLVQHDLDQAIHHGERLLEIDLEGASENVLIKEVQYDTFGQEILHVDLARVDLDERVEVTVPIVLRGTPAGAADGGVLQQSAPEVSIECLVTAIPEEIRLQVNDMKIDDVKMMKDLALPEGAKLLADPEVLVCSVVLIAEEAPPAEGEEVLTEPEVIGAKKEEEEEGESDSQES